jgi:SH3-like domain-containing protein
VNLGLRFFARVSLPLIALAAAIVFPGIAHPQAPGRDALPIPRFVSLDADRVNARSGPGLQYPIRWVYERAGLPVKIVAEFGEAWRRIQDMDGDEAWVRANLISGRRTILVTGAARPLRREPSEKGRVVLTAEPGVIGRLLECRPRWCWVEIHDSRGWMARGDFWGLLDTE